MSNKDVESYVVDQIKELVKDTKKLQDKNYKDLHFSYDLGLDSLQIVEMFLQCESSFNIAFTDKEIYNTTTIDSLINLIFSKLNAKK